MSAESTGLRPSVTDNDVARALRIWWPNGLNAHGHYQADMRKVLEDFAARAAGGATPQKPVAPDDKPDPLTVECSFCLAKPGKPCRFSKAGARMAGARKGDPCAPHQYRIDRARYEANKVRTSAGRVDERPATER